VFPLDEQQLAVVVVHHRTDGRLRRDVTGDALAHVLHPLVDQFVGYQLAAGRGADLGRDGEDLLEALTLIEVVGETETRPRDGREGFAPPQQVTLRVHEGRLTKS